MSRAALRMTKKHADGAHLQSRVIRPLQLSFVVWSLPGGG